MCRVRWCGVNFEHLQFQRWNPNWVHASKETLCPRGRSESTREPLHHTMLGEACSSVAKSGKWPSGERLRQMRAGYLLMSVEWFVVDLSV